VTGDWRNLHEELHNFSSSGIIKSREIRWMGYAACMEEMRNSYKILIRKPEGKKPLQISRCRWNVIKNLS
jgi:hypothetical protein